MTVTHTRLNPALAWDIVEAKRGLMSMIRGLHGVRRSPRPDTDQAELRKRIKLLVQLRGLLVDLERRLEDDRAFFPAERDCAEVIIKALRALSPGGSRPGGEETSTC